MSDYAVKRFADRYWIERIGGTIHGTPVGIRGHMFVLCLHYKRWGYLK